MGFLSLLSHFSGLSSYLKDAFFNDFRKFYSVIPDAVHPLLILKVKLLDETYTKGKGKKKILPCLSWE